MLGERGNINNDLILLLVNYSQGVMPPPYHRKVIIHNALSMKLYSAA